MVIDAYSKWPEVFLTRSASAQFTITALRKCFRREGLPQVIVSDNGTHFTAASVKEWLASLKVKQVFSAPRHPQSNGLAENFVRSLKTAVRTNDPQSFEELDKVMDNFLLNYRNAKHTTTNEAPSQLLKGRVLYHPPHGSVEVSFWRGNENRVTSGIILSRIGNNMFNILDLSDGSVHRRHRDQLRLTRSPETSVENALNPEKSRPSSPDGHAERSLPTGQFCTRDVAGGERANDPISRPGNQPNSRTTELENVPLDSWRDRGESGTMPHQTDSGLEPRAIEPGDLPSDRRASHSEITPDDGQDEPEREPRSSTRRRRQPTYLDDYVC